MMAGSHVAVGVAAWAWAAPLGLPALDPIAVARTLGGAPLPDIDHPQSWVGSNPRIFDRVASQDANSDLTLFVERVTS